MLYLFNKALRITLALSLMTNASFAFASDDNSSPVPPLEAAPPASAASDVTQRRALIDITMARARGMGAAVSGLAESSKKVIDKVPPKVSESFGKQATSMLQSYLVSIILIGASDLQRRAHERNLKIDPKTANKLSEEITGEWGASARSGYLAKDILIMSIPAIAANTAIKSLAEKLISNTATVKLISPLIAGTALSVGMSVVADIIYVSSRMVYEKPELFGGLTQKEELSLALLQQRFSPSYFITGLRSGGPATKSAYGKVYDAMFRIIWNDEPLKSTLLSHIWREAILTGSNLNMIVFSVLGSVMKNKFIPERDASITVTKAMRASDFAKNIGFSVAFGLLVTMLTPTMLQDEETYMLRAAWANSQSPNLSELSHEEYEALIKKQDDCHHPSCGMQYLTVVPYLNGVQDTSLILKKIGSSRRSRVVQYVSLAKLSLDRISSLKSELIQIQTIEKQDEETIKKVGWINYFKQKYPGLEFFKAMASNIIAQDIIPNSLADNYYASKISHYTKMYRRALRAISNIYSIDSQYIFRLAANNRNPAVIAAINDYSKNLVTLQGHFDYIGRVMDPTNITADLDSQTAGRELIERWAFWGVSEEEILRSIR